MNAVAVRATSRSAPRVVSAVIASSRPRRQTFELAREVEHGFGAAGRARLHYFAPYDRRLGRRDVLVVVVLADSLEAVA